MNPQAKYEFLEPLHGEGARSWRARETSNGVEATLHLVEAGLPFDIRDRKGVIEAGETEGTAWVATVAPPHRTWDEWLKSWSEAGNEFGRAGAWKAPGATPSQRPSQPRRAPDTPAPPPPPPLEVSHEAPEPPSPLAATRFFESTGPDAKVREPGRRRSEPGIDLGATGAMPVPPRPVPKPALDLDATGAMPIPPKPAPDPGVTGLLSIPSSGAPHRIATFSFESTAMPEPQQPATPAPPPPTDLDVTGAMPAPSKPAPDPGVTGLLPVPPRATPPTPARSRLVPMLLVVLALVALAVFFVFRG